VVDDSKAVELGGDSSTGGKIVPHGILPAPLSLRMYDAVIKRAEAHKGHLGDPLHGLDIIGFDVTYGHAHVPQGLVEGYFMQITARGLLLGPQYYVTSVHPLGRAIPSDQEIDMGLTLSAQVLHQQRDRQRGSGNGSGPAQSFG
jgi:hypothetical protein